MRRTRWGILGNAKIARDFLIPAIQLSRSGQLVALASRDREKALEACERFSIAQQHDSYEGLLASPDVDAVYIPLPNTMHVEWTQRAVAAGKHVLCEKPLAMHAGEIDALIEARERSGLVVGEAFMVAHHPQWKHVRSLIASGRIGRLRMVEGSFSYHNTDGNNIRNRSELGGGALRDIGVYPVVTTRFVTGQEPVSATARIEWDAAFGTDKLAICLLAFEGFHLSFYCATQAARRQHMAFHGEKGWIRLDAPFNAGVYDQARVLVRLNDVTGTEEVIFPQANHYLEMVENFGDAVQGKAPLAFPLESSRANQRVIDMLFEAGKPVQGAHSYPGS
jgi:predicted dehydrogenase